MASIGKLVLLVDGWNHLKNPNKSKHKCLPSGSLQLQSGPNHAAPPPLATKHMSLLKCLSVPSSAQGPLQRGMRAQKRPDPHNNLRTSVHPENISCSLTCPAAVHRRWQLKAHFCKLLKKQRIESPVWMTFIREPTGAWTLNVPRALADTSLVAQPPWPTVASTPSFNIPRRSPDLDQNSHTGVRQCA